MTLSESDVSNTDSFDSTTSRRKKRLRRKDESIITTNATEPRKTESIEVQTNNVQNINIESGTEVSFTAEAQVDVEMEFEENQQASANIPKISSLKPRKESTVSIKVRDVRDLNAPDSRFSDRTSERSSPSKSFMSSLNFGLRDERQSTTKIPLSTSSTTSKVVVPSQDVGSVASMDPLQRMLLDAKEMESMQSKNGMKDRSTSNSDDDDGSLGSNVRKVISTIVTIDFFVVCGFLLWFLTGIFCSYVLKDDTVQILFNSNFQGLVQPALGILMIAAISDAIFKKGDDVGP